MPATTFAQVINGPTDNAGGNEAIGSLLVPTGYVANSGYVIGISGGGMGAHGTTGANNFGGSSGAQFTCTFEALLGTVTPGTSLVYYNIDRVGLFAGAIIGRTNDFAANYVYAANGGDGTTIAGAIGTASTDAISFTTNRSGNLGTKVGSGTTGGGGGGSPGGGGQGTASSGSTGGAGGTFSGLDTVTPNADTGGAGGNGGTTGLNGGNATSPGGGAGAAGSGAGHASGVPGAGRLVFIYQTASGTAPAITNIPGLNRSAMGMGLGLGISL